jgi:hypothetical protein
MQVALHVHPEDLREGLVQDVHVQVVEATVEVEDPDAADHDVQSAVGGDGRRDGLRVGRRRRGVPADDRDLRQVAFEGGALRLVPLEDGHPGAFFPVGVDDRAADPGTAADDERRASGEPPGRHQSSSRNRGSIGWPIISLNVRGLCQVSDSSSSGHNATHCPVRVDSMSSRDPLRVSRRLTRISANSLPRLMAGSGPPPGMAVTGRSPGSASAAPTRRP